MRRIMDPTARIRLSLGFVSIAINMIFGKDRGRKNLLSPGGIEVLYSAYFSKVCMGDIAGLLDITPSSATDLVNYLEREGFVRRVQDPQNRRSLIVVPTEKGEDRLGHNPHFCHEHVTPAIHPGSPHLIPHHSYW